MALYASTVGVQKGIVIAISYLLMPHMPHLLLVPRLKSSAPHLILKMSSLAASQPIFPPYSLLRHSKNLNSVWC